jgi:hypothetical protein
VRDGGVIGVINFGGMFSPIDKVEEAAFNFLPQ